MSRAVPSHPQRRHHCVRLHNRIGQDPTTRFQALPHGFQAELVQTDERGQGWKKVASSASRSSGWVAYEPRLSGGFDPHPATDAWAGSTPSTVKSRLTGGWLRLPDSRSLWGSLSALHPGALIGPYAPYCQIF